MILKAHEAALGIKHVSYRLQRSILQRPTNFHLRKLNSCTMPFAELKDANGVPALCEVCGYAMARIQMPSGWVLDLCSAVPVVNFGKAEFWRWQCELPEETGSCDTPLKATSQ